MPHCKLFKQADSVFRVTFWDIYKILNLLRRIALISIHSAICLHGTEKIEFQVWKILISNTHFITCFVFNKNLKCFSTKTFNKREAFPGEKYSNILLFR